MGVNDEFEQAVKSVDKLIWWIVDRYARRFDCDPDDAHQECVMLLWRKWPQYDPARSKFTTFVTNVCRRHLRQAHIAGRISLGAVRVSRNGHEKGDRIQVASLNEMCNGLGFDTPEKASRLANMPEAFVATAEGLVGRQLSDIERRVLVSRFIDRCEFPDVAKNCGLPNRQRAQYILNKFAAEARLHREITEGA